MLVLSKVVYLFLAPLSWLILALLLWIFVKNEGLKKYCKYTSLFIVFFFSNTFILKEFSRAWDIHAVSKENIGHYEVAIVLGGMFEFDNSVERLSIRRGGDRLWQALDLYHSGKVDKICIVGGSGYVFDHGLDEARQVKEILAEWGYPEEDIIIETASRNTYENAKFTVELFKEEYPEYQSFLLVTSSSHMRRARALFKKQGLDFDIFPTDQGTEKKRFYYWDEFIIPSSDTFTSWFNFNKEVVGYVGYYLMGKI